MNSNFERRKDDDYKTIDPRCTYALLEHIEPIGLCVDVCAPDGSGIVDVLLEQGYRATGIPDALTGEKVVADWIITNPPYTRPLVDQIVERQVKRIADKEVYGLAVLLRHGWDFALGRAGLFRDCPYYAGQIKMLFRPWWTDSREKNPFHVFVWQIWTAEAKKPPFVLYATGDILL